MQVPYDLTRGSFKTIPASEETTNTQRFEADSLADEPVNGEPVSGSEFPVIREKNREFRKIASLEQKTGANFEANSECYRQIPCATEQGITFARTGNFEQRNRECIRAIRESV